MIDGYPRTLQQAQLCEEKLGIVPSKVLWLDAPVYDMLDRLKLREYKQDRVDTAEGVAQTRVDAYLDHRDSIVQYYKERGSIIRIDAAGAHGTVRHEMTTALAASMTEWNTNRLMDRFPNLNMLVRRISKGEPGLCRYSERNQTYMDDAMEVDGAEPVHHHYLDMRAPAPQMDKKFRKVDPSASEDTLVTSFVVALANGKNVTEALSFARQAGQLASTVLGAAESIPKKEDIVTEEDLINKEWRSQPSSDNSDKE